MASSFNLKTKEVKRSTIFDYMAPGMTNLKIGAPGDSVLKKCAEAVKKAAVHRMVAKVPVSAARLQIASVSLKIVFFVTRCRGFWCTMVGAIYGAPSCCAKRFF